MDIQEGDQISFKRPLLGVVTIRSIKRRKWWQRDGRRYSLFLFCPESPSHLQTITVPEREFEGIVTDLMEYRGGKHLRDGKPVLA